MFDYLPQGIGDQPIIDRVVSNLSVAVGGKSH